MLTDSSSLTVIFTKASATTVKRLKKDLQNLQSSYDKTEIEDVAYNRSVLNIADSLTKIITNSIILTSFENSNLNDRIKKTDFRESSCDLVV